MQYASGEAVDELKGYGYQISTAHTDNPYENAVMQSFFKILQCEEAYNRKRLHSALRYSSPNDFEELLATNQNKDVPRQTLLTLPVQSQGCAPDYHFLPSPCLVQNSHISVLL